MSIDIDQLKADRAAGTQGPWELRKVDVPCMSPDDREAWEIIGAGGACVTDTQDYYPEPLSEVDIRRVSRLDELEAAYIAQCEKRPSRYTVGPATMERVFKAAGLTNVSDLQAVLDAVEQALSK